MSLKISDLGLTDMMRDLAEDLESAKIHFAEIVQSEVNPFTPAIDIPQLLFSSPAFMVQSLTAQEARMVFGSSDHLYYRCAIATPNAALVPMLKTGIYAFLNISDGAKVVNGTVERIDKSLSSLIYVYVDSSQTVPFRGVDIGVIV
jgi:hypothetical protein